MRSGVTLEDAAAPRGESWRPSVPEIPPVRLTDAPTASSDMRQSDVSSGYSLPLAAPERTAKDTFEVAQRTVMRVTTTTFDQHVLASDVPVLVDFYADWCGPCRALTPTLEQVAAENPQARVVKVNIDDSPELAARYGVTSVPRLLVFKDGQIAARQNGVASKSRLNAMLALSPAAAGG